MKFFKSKSLSVKFKKMSNKAKTPTKAYTFDAAFDLYSVDEIAIPSNEQREVKVGLAFEIPEGWHMQIHTRSSYGKKMLRCHLGIVDSGYRNELSIWVHNFSNDVHYVKEGDKICQILFLPVPETILSEVNELTPSERGEKGHGSSGR